MNDTPEKKEKKTLTLGGKSTLSLKTPTASAPSSPAPTRQTVTGSRANANKTVAVEVRRKRLSPQEAAALKAEQAEKDAHLNNSEREARMRAVQQAQQAPAKEPVITGQTRIVAKNLDSGDDNQAQSPETVTPTAPNESLSLRDQELLRLQQIEEQERARLAAEKRKLTPNAPATADTGRSASPTDDSRGRMTGRKIAGYTEDEQAESNRQNKKLRTPSKIGDDDDRRRSRLTVQQAMDDEFEERSIRIRSMASQRRQREKERLKAKENAEPAAKQYREVIIPEAITVQELSNRMSERVSDVIKKLMKMGVMATATQSLDADTAELVTTEFGHTVKRVADSDVEIDLLGDVDADDTLINRPPVVTIMGHVDHGKTSLLDALRSANVVASEAGGITQHIGAYQIEAGKNKSKVTFIDTPGHAAFTEMRARGADVTDIVILVVAADDSVMPQTIEAIHHAKAAKKLLIVAINKCDLPTANPQKVKSELLSYEVVVEDMGGDVQCVEVSAKAKKNLEGLVDAILLQAEVLELKANPNRTAKGAVIESRLEQGRGSVATVLIQSGTVRVGDIFVSGTETGRVRALINDLGQNIKQAIPGQPVEIIGLNGTPEAGDDFVVVKDDAKAREVADFRMRRRRDLENAKARRGSLEQLMSQIKLGAKELYVIIKGDVHGSIEAIASSLRKLTEENTEVKVNILHTAVGAITESDITLAKASRALIVGFNVRANNQARDMAKRDGVEIRYYSIIYNVIDDVKKLLGGLLSPEVSEQFIGYAEIRQVFNISKYGKIAGCFITQGVVKRGAKVRLLRDSVVIHEGVLKTLRRFKDEVREAKEGFECGMAFENYEDIKEGDMIECFEISEKARAFESTPAA
jgi:translation initiation factor IF-2